MRKMKRKNYYQCLGGIMLAALLLATGCSNKEKKEVAPSLAPTTQVESSTQPTAKPETSETEQLHFEDEVLKVGEESVTYRELLIYLLQIKNKYEPSLGKDVWSVEIGDGKTFNDQAKDQLLSEITEIKIINQQAKKLEIQLEEDEKDEISLAVNAYLEKITKEDQEKYGITKDVVSKVLSENYLAEKVFAISTNEVDTNISDEEARQIKLQQIVVLTEGENKDGIEIMLDEKEKKSALKRAKTLREKAVEAEDFNAFATANSESPCVEFTLGKGDMPEIEEVAFKLKVNQVSDIIETPTGYVILKLVNANDEDATRLKKEEIIEKRQSEVFEAKYKIWSSDYKVTQNMKCWKAISFDL